MALPVAGKRSPQDGGSAGSVAAPRPWTPGVPRTETEATPGPPGSPGIGRRPWGARREEERFTRFGVHTEGSAELAVLFDQAR